MNNETTLGERLAEALKLYKISAIARRVGVTEVTLRNYMQNRVTPKSKTLQDVAALIGISLTWLIEGRGPKFMHEITGIDYPPSPELKKLLDGNIVFNLSDSESKRLQHVDQVLQQSDVKISTDLLILVIKGIREKANDR